MFDFDKRNHRLASIAISTITASSIFAAFLGLLFLPDDTFVFGLAMVNYAAPPVILVGVAGLLWSKTSLEGQNFAIATALTGGALSAFASRSIELVGTGLVTKNESMLVLTAIAAVVLAVGLFPTRAISRAE